ncbi:MAG: molybdate transporter family protein [Planctomycetota bacterium]
MKHTPLGRGNPEESRPALCFNRAELGGALGDLGSFVPLLVGMVTCCGLQLGPALFLSGAANVGTGLLFGIPIPIQPMKVIAAVAIDEGLNESQILIAGIGVGVVLLLLTLTHLIDWLDRAIPKSVVRGLQLGLGLKLLAKGIVMVAGTQTFLGPDSIGLGILCTLIVLLFYYSTRVPAALLVFTIGLVAMMAAQPSLLGETRFGISWRLPDLSNWSDWRTGILQGAVPQIPLTVLNSVIAICVLSVDLFPRSPLKPGRVALSVAVLNLITCPLGGMPLCHGSGGLAAQHRFGARTGGSMVVLGAAKMALALGGSLLAWMQSYPQSVLGVLLLFSGMELAMVCRDQHSRGPFFVMVLTTGTCIAVNTAVGFVVGWIMAALLARGIFRIDRPPTT